MDMEKIAAMIKSGDDEYFDLATTILMEYSITEEEYAQLSNLLGVQYLMT